MSRTLCFFRVWLLLLLSFDSQIVFAQLPHEMPDYQDKEELYFRHITREDGLPSSVVRCITQDFLGYMWFGTDNGLVRYDGNKMKIFQYIPGDSACISESTIISLFESSDSLLWIGTNNGFSIYNPFWGTFKNYKTNPGDPNSFPGNEVRFFWEDRDKSIWIATNNGLIHYKRVTNTFKLFLSNNSANPDREQQLKFVYRIAEDPRDYSKILVTTVGGLIQINKSNGRITHRYEIEKNAFYETLSMYFEGDSIVWTGEWATGLKKINLKTDSCETYFFEKNYYGSVLSIAKKSDNELWLATPGKGLVVFNKKKKTFTYHLNNHVNPRSILSNSVECNLFVDRNANLWVGGSEGLNILDLQYHSFKRIDIPLDIEYVRCFYRDKLTRKMYFGVRGKSNIVVWDEQQHTWSYIYNDSPEVKPFARVNTIYKDTQGKIWVGTAQNNLLYLDEKNNLLKLYKTVDGQPLKLTKTEPAINYLIEDGTGALWASTAIDGVIRINKERTEAAYFKNEPDNINSLRYGSHHFEIDFDKYGRLWIGSYDGFDVYDVENKIFMHNVADTLQYLGVKNSNAYSFERDTLGRMWVAMPSEGLLRVTETKRGHFDYKIFHTQHGFNDLNIARMTSDPDGNFWIINEGLAKFNPYTEALQIYDRRNGLWQTKSYDDRIYIDYEGNIFLNSGKAYETRNCRDVFTCSGIINLLIEDIEVNGSRNIKGNFSGDSSRIVLEAGENNLNFLFTAICFQDIDQIQYQYKLVGYQEDWSLPGKISNARYTNLAPGKYEFIVKVAHRGVWIDSPKSVKFLIKPFFWQTVWFKMLIIIVILMILYAIYRVKVNRIKREEKIKTMFQKKIAEVEMQALRAQMNPHFIFNSLNSINNFILKNESELASDFLTKFSRLIRQVLNNSRNKLVTLEDEFEALRLYIELEQLRFNNKFSYHFDIDNYLDINLVHIPPLLIQPYVENAIWHGLMHKESHGNITIKAYQEDEKLFFIIADDGIGRKKAEEYKSRFGIRKKSMGMDITTDRIAIINKMFHMEASMEVIDLYDDNHLPSGTKVMISIPVITKEASYD